jgi:hypothetical protein
VDHLHCRGFVACQNVWIEVPRRLHALGPIKISTDTKLPNTVLRLKGTGWWVLGLDDKHFHVLYSPTAEGIQALAQKAFAEKWQPIPASAYPRWLDCFHNASLGFWVHGGGALTDDQSKDLAWIADRGFTACFADATETRLVAPGVLDTTIMDWEDAISKKYNLPYRTLQSWGSPMRPSWPWNRTPLPHVTALDDYHPYGDFDHLQFASYNVYEPTPATDAYQFDMRRRLASQDEKYDNFIGHHGSAEMGSAGLSELTAMGGNPEIQKLWHSYVRLDGLATQPARPQFGRDTLPAPARQHLLDPAARSSKNRSSRHL